MTSHQGQAEYARPWGVYYVNGRKTVYGMGAMMRARLGVKRGRRPRA